MESRSALDNAPALCCHAQIMNEAPNTSEFRYTDNPTGRPPPPTVWQRIRKMFVPLVIGVVVVLKFLAKLKFVILPLLKYGMVFLKTGGTMFLSIWFYAMAFGWWFAVGFVLLLLVHESGHLLAARRAGLAVGAPVFIPFMGAFIALKEAPRNAWIEAQVGMGGPLVGALGAVACEVVYRVTGLEIFRGLAYSGFFLNLFNLMPVGFLDGGRIVTALSPWLWVVGIVGTAALTILHFNFLLFLILIMSLPRVFSLFRRKSEEEKRYFEVTPLQRWTTGILYFGLIVLLVVGMNISLKVEPHL